MHKIFLVLFGLITGVSAIAQQNETIEVFDSKWRSSSEKKAQYLRRSYKLGDSCYVWEYYQYKGPMIRSERTADSEGKVFHGASYHYNEAGFLDSMGTFRQGKKHGEFVRLKPDKFAYDVIYTYSNDSLVNIELVKPKPKADLAGNALEQESDYPGGAGAWQRFLNQNLRYPERSINLRAMGTAIVAFAVDETGGVTGPFLVRSVELGIDSESLRMIKKSGKWTPAVRNGEPVKSFKLQPLTFRLEKG
ncbi:energy transducer TonB [Flavihumibacter petaseus]|uniref:TonB C-terminal domain-containing protein n=1 Tax=Flavihumibacter petaseus NBRC 106054 TaxID=1220578 RepID=A0A0E9MZ10_9BACT|nr:energy transducer TonB [Flavihumibacter petaseus]GAO42641.1 hypothetical protein FPE01S_01_16560 [Flavihumibacter petaseus NBRC 106054]